jgi:hypothetical protein
VRRLWDAVASWLADRRWPTIIIAQKIEYAPTGDEAALLVTRPGRRDRLHILASRDQFVALARTILDGERADLRTEAEAAGIGLLDQRDELLAEVERLRTVANELLLRLGCRMPAEPTCGVHCRMGGFIAARERAAAVAALRWEADQLREVADARKKTDLRMADAGRYFASCLEIDAHRIEAGTLTVEVDDGDH